jgi:adenylate cyclase class IV
MIQFKEIEFKYKADNISLEGFRTFCEARNPRKTIQASGFDYFFDNAKDPDSFYRHRVGADTNQLTYKKKKSDVNNVIRDEQNVNLDPKETPEHVRAFLARFKYNFNTALFKTCFVYNYDKYTLVYYICYDTGMKELGRFIEIEMSEEHSWATEQEAYGELVIIEKLCKEIGLTPQNRVRRSLYEMFCKERNK